MGELFTGWRFVFPRVRSSWRLLSVTAVGVLIAAALLAAAPIYADALSNLGLQFRLDRSLDQTRLNTVTIERLLPGDAVDVARRDAVDTIFDARVGWLGPERLVEERSPRLNLDFVEPTAVAAGGEVIEHQPWNAFLYWLSGFERRMTVTEGRLPAPDGPPEVVLLDGFQRHAALGDRITFTVPPYDDCEDIDASLDPAVARFEVRCKPTVQVAESVAATVVGFVRPNDPGDERWDIFNGTFEVPDEPFLPHVEAALADDPFGGGVSVDVTEALAGKGSMPLLTSKEQLFGAFGVATPTMPMRHRVGLIADVRSLTLGDVERGIDSTQRLGRDIDQRLDLTALVRFPVGTTLSDFRNTRSFEQVPLLIILLQVVGIVIYFVAVVASMLVERQAEEISVYRSRGASTPQLVGLYVMEGVLIAAFAAAVAPWIAGQGVAALGYTPIFSVMTDGGALPVTITPGAFLLAAGGATLALLALLLPAFVVARRAIVDVKREQSRPPGRSIVQRYYLDLAVVVFAGILLWQLGQRGTVFDPDSVGGFSSDPVLLAAPFVFTLAVAALVLRLYPPLLRWAVALLLAAGGTAVALGLRRAARAPAVYARLMVLLVMAISVGTFAASYGPTVDRSQADRVRYQTGVDIRGPFQESDAGQAFDLIADVRAIEGVNDAALVRRDQLPSATTTPMQLLALDPERTPSMLWFRDDFADQSLPALMRRLQSAVPSGGGVTMAEDAKALKVSLSATDKRPRSLLWVRLRDASGSYTNVRVTSLDFEGWRDVLVPLPEDRGRRPWTFVGFRVTEPRGAAVPKVGALYIDDLRAVLANGSEVLLDDFERSPGRFGWSMFSGRATKEEFALSNEQSVSGSLSAKWSWPVGMASGARYLLMNDPNVPLAAIVNPLAAARLRAGAGGIGTALLGDLVVPIRVVAVVDLFPTLSPDLPFVVLNVRHLRELAATLNVLRFRPPNELWVSTDTPLATQETLVETLTAPGTPLRLVDVRHQGAELETVRADPTLRASGSGILTAAFSAVLIVSMLGFVVTLILGARARIVEFAVLRAVGSSSLQILRSMVLEWGIVLVIGASIGVLLGLRVAQTMLSFLDVTEDGTRVVPPFTLQTNWLTLGLGVAALTAVAAVSLAFAWGTAVRRETSVELRLTR